MTARRLQGKGNAELQTGNGEDGDAALLVCRVCPPFMVGLTRSTQIALEIDKTLTLSTFFDFSHSERMRQVAIVSVREKESAGLTVTRVHRSNSRNIRHSADVFNWNCDRYVHVTWSWFLHIVLKLTTHEHASSKKVRADVTAIIEKMDRGVACQTQTHPCHHNVGQIETSEKWLLTLVS